MQTYSSRAQGWMAKAVPAKQRMRRCTSRIVHRGRLACSAEYTPYPFAKQDYLKCVVRVASAGSQGTGYTNGTLIFMLESDMRRMDVGGLMMDPVFSETGKALFMIISGESLDLLMRVVENRASTRPMALELLLTILQRGQEISKKEWKLLYIAVVSIQNQAFVARLFFGDAETGEVVWDCDCRPSDATWLALKSKCPIFMHKDVWKDHSRSWRESVRRDAPAKPVSNTDPEPVKRLKREMEVALSEEDFRAAVRIRDHPFMMLARRIDENERDGRLVAAAELKAELNYLIALSDKSLPQGFKDDTPQT